MFTFFLDRMLYGFVTNIHLKKYVAKSFSIVTLPDTLLLSRREELSRYFMSKDN